MVAEHTLHANQQDFRLILDSIPAFVYTTGPEDGVEFVNRQILEYLGKTQDEFQQWVASGGYDGVHPDDLPGMSAARRGAEESGQPCDMEHRLRGADGRYRWFHHRCIPRHEASGRIAGWQHLLTDIESRKCAESALRASQERLNLIVDGIAGLVAIMTTAGEVDLVNRPALEYFGKTLAELQGWTTSDAVHPGDLPQVLAAWRHSVETGQQYDVDHRLRRADGIYRWFHARGLPLRHTDGRTVHWYVLLTDIDDRKQTEEKLRRSEESLLEAQRLSHTGSWRHDISSGTVTVSPEVCRIFELAPDRDTFTAEFLLSRNHPEDAERVRELLERCESGKTEYEADYRIVVPDGSIKHLHAIGHPVLNQAGQLVEFVGTVVDVTDHWRARIALEKAFEEIKHLKDRLQDENIALREQIDRAFMFEEIVGSSAVLQTVLTSIVKVAPTDSTVLINGETGTGKELIARAIHKRSRRCAQPFISVNCAAIPPSLIASELFGHEKGAFTGALQQRRGRFELAHLGTIFLDEIGELPAETQISLLRVLQEREFERVGGNRAIATDVRVIAATNRDLRAAIAAGTFRPDLFYRLNVFPIQVPPLRQRQEDIPLLVEYFVERFAEKTGKTIRKIDKRTLKLCQRYHWPGNIRELQNIVERAVILGGDDTFTIDEAWLAVDETPELEVSGSLAEMLKTQEKTIIEAALMQSKGKVAGVNGAAAKLGIAPSTLDSKIKHFQINKHKFTAPWHAGPRSR